MNLIGEIEDSDILDQLERIFHDSGIHIDRNKNPLAVVIDQDGKVYGGVYYSFDPSGDYHNGKTIYEYSFDVAVDPKERAFSMTGPRLIAYAMNFYEQEKNSYEGYTKIKLWVVNPRLADYLKDKYDWDDEYSAGGDTFLEKY